MLALLREGLNNVEIAERLGISRATAAYHVSEILSKLDVSSRQEAAAWRPERRMLGLGLLGGLIKLSPVEVAVKTSSAIAVTGGIATLVAIAVGLLLIQSRSEGRPDPSVAGPFAVGNATRSTTWTLPDGTERFVEYELWYPVSSGQAGAPFGSAPANFPLNSTADSPVASEVARPLVIFSPGWGLEPYFTSYLHTHWASHGFVIAIPLHRDCPTCAHDHAVVRSGDLTAVLDDVLSRKEGDDPLLAHAIDTTQIAVAGHLFGGYTALKAMEGAEMFSAAVVIAPLLDVGFLPPGSSAAAPEDVTKPTMIVQGEWEKPEYRLFSASSGFFEGLPATTPRWFVDIHRAIFLGNTGCTDVGFYEGFCKGTLEQHEVAILVKKWTTAFLLSHVGMDARYDDSLDPRIDRNPMVTVLKGGPGQEPEVVPTPRPLP